MKNRIARLAVRPNPGHESEGVLILGLGHVDIFKPGKVYEVIEIMGEHIIREVGDSAANDILDPKSACGFKVRFPGCTWNRDVNGLVIDGRHLLTATEVLAAEKYQEDKQKAFDEGRDFTSHVDVSQVKK